MNIIKKRYFWLITAMIIFLMFVLIDWENTKTIVTNETVITSNSTDEEMTEKKYQHILERITNNERIIIVVQNRDLTEEEMKNIYIDCDRKYEFKLWIFDTEENARNLNSYNIAEVKKENNEYIIHRFGEETEEEKALRLERERITKEEEKRKKEEEISKKEAEEKAKKEQEETEFKASCSTYTFKEIARNPQKNKGSKVKLTGKVVQTIYGSYETDLRVNITKEGTYSTFYTDTIYVVYFPEIGEDKILEDDIITLWGTSEGDYTYTSTLGTEVNLPLISAKYIEIK